MILLVRLLMSRAAVAAIPCLAGLAMAWVQGASWERSRWERRMAASEAAYDRNWPSA